MTWRQPSGLLFLVVAACLPAGCNLQQGTEATPAAAPTPAPLPPILVKEGSLAIYSTAGGGIRTSFSINATGTLRINLDWTAIGKETTLNVRVLARSYEGPCAPGCEREDLCPSQCRTDMEHWIDLATHPTSLLTPSSLKPGNYELQVTFYDPLDYTIPWHPDGPPRVTFSYQIFLNPASPAPAGLLE